MLALLAFSSNSLAQSEDYDMQADDRTAPPSTLLVRMNELQEQMQQLRGQLEESQFRAQKNAADLKSLSEDVEYRLSALEKQISAVKAAPVANAPVNDLVSEAASTEDVSDENIDAEPTVKKKLEKEAIKSDKAQKFATSREHYNYAYSLINKGNYDQAGAAFQSFLNAYPKDPLVSNVNYWLGETWYARTEYSKAASSFRKGFESSPKGQKAPDNLLKLGMSLAKLEKKKEACIILSQIAIKFPKAPSATTQKAEKERALIGCKAE